MTKWLSKEPFIYHVSTFSDILDPLSLLQAKIQQVLKGSKHWFSFDPISPYLNVNVHYRKNVTELRDFRNLCVGLNYAFSITHLEERYIFQNFLQELCNQLWTHS